MSFRFAKLLLVFSLLIASTADGAHVASVASDGVRQTQVTGLDGTTVYMLDNLVDTSLPAAGRAIGTGYTTSQMPKHMFTGSQSDYWRGKIGPAIAVYAFDEPTVVEAYGIYNAASGVYNVASRGPKTFTFSGSNDGVTWTQIDSQVNAANWAASEFRLFVTSNKRAYRRYRLQVSAVSDNQYVQISELEFYAFFAAWPTGEPEIGTNSFSTDVALRCPSAADLKIVWSTDPGFSSASTNLVGTALAAGKHAASITGLAEGTAYWWKIVADSGTETVESAPLSFRTREVLDPSLFTYRVQATVSGYRGTSTLTNFPVLVTLAADSPVGFSYADCAADGSDLRFVDENGLLVPHEIETWDTNGTSCIWVKLPRLVGTATGFSMYFSTNGTDAPPSLAAADVWSSYATVVHGGSAITDATGNAAAVNVNGVVGAASGGIAGGLANKPSQSVVGIAYSNPLLSAALGNLTHVAMSGWFRRTTDPGTAILAANKNSTWTNTGFSMMDQGGQYFSVGVGVDNAGANQPSSTNGRGALVKNAWCHVAFAYDGDATNLVSYFNGLPVFETDSARAIGDVGDAYWSLGSFNNEGKNSFVGDMDEFRLYDGTAPADWIQAEYDSIAAPESFVVASSVASIHAPAIGAHTASVSQNDVTFSVCVESFPASASVSVFYRANGAPSFEELQLGSATVAGTTLSATVPGLGAGVYVWYARAVSSVGGTDHAAMTAQHAFAIAHAKDPAAACNRFTAAIAYGGTAVSGVPLLLRLSEAGIKDFSYGDVTESGFEFLDEDGNLLPYEIDTWNTNGTSLVWVLAPSFADGAELTIRYGANFSNPGFPASDVWASYVGVWHMNKILEDSAAGKHYTPDSSASGWHAYKALEGDAVPAPVTNATGVTAHPTPLTGTAMNIAYGAKKAMSDIGGFIVPASATSLTTLNGPGFTLSAFVNSQQAANNGLCRVIAFGNAYNDRANLSVGSDYIHCMSASSHKKTNPKGKTGWVYASDVFSVPSFIYADAANISGAAGGDPNLTSLSLDKGIGLGCFTDGKQCLDGYLDEARIRNAASSAEWIAAEYAAIADESIVSFSRVSVIDTATPVLDVPTFVRNQDGSFTITVRVSENVPASVVCPLGGTDYPMSTSDAELPMSYSVTVSDLEPGTYVAQVTAESTTGNPVYAACPTAFHAGALVVTVVSNADEGTLTPGVFRIARADADATDLPEIPFDVVFSGEGLAAVVNPGVSTLMIPAGAAYADISITPVYTPAVNADTAITISVSGAVVGQSSTATLTVFNADYDPSVRYVDTNGSDANHGGTPEFPKQTIGAAVKSLANVAQLQACTVHVAPGLYTTNPQVYVTNAISIVGADADPSRTVVSNSFTTGWEHKNQRCFYVNHPAAKIANLTMQKGGVTDQRSGGTLYIGSRGGMVTNCVVECGTTLLNSYAGGACLDGGLVTHTIFRKNQSGCDGGSWQGSNKAGVLALNGSSHAENCLFVGNNQGNAVVLVHLYGSSVMRNCTIVDSALSKTNDYCKSWSALVVDSGATAQNVVIAGVTNKVDGAPCPPTGSVAKFLNGAFDGNVAGLLEGTITGTAAEFFEDYANGDYTPKTGGLLVNVGTDYDGMAASDLAGKKRKVGKHIDIGCYECQKMPGLFIFVR